MIVYADLLFFINFIVVYIIISITGAYKYAKVSLKKRVFASVLGGIFAIFIYVNNSATLVKVIIYLLSVFVICKIAYGEKIKRTMGYMIVFLFVIFVMQSVFILIVSLFKNNIALTLRNNIIYFDISPKLILLCFIITYPVVCLIAKFMQAQTKNRIYNLTIINNGKSVNVKALFDSGNLLKEPISNKDVIILEEKYAEQILRQDEKIIEIPYCTVSGNGVLKAFMPDIIFVDDTHFLKLQYIAITQNKLSNSGEYNALIGNIGGD